MRGARAAAALAGLWTAAGCGEGGAEQARGPATAAQALAPIEAGPAGLGAYFDCLSREGVTLVAAHRGGPSRGFPENALATFAHTLSLAPALIEVDVASTRDGVLVLMHDDTLDRTTTCEGAVADHAWSELAACRLEDGAGRPTTLGIPRLEDALAWAKGRTVLELDIKPSVRYEDVVEAVRQARAQERVVLITYSAAPAARLAALAPELVISASIESVADLAEHEDGGPASEQLIAWTGTDAPDAALNAALDEREVPVIFGTLGDPARSIDGEIARTGQESRYREIADQGVDIIATDRPIAAYRALAGEGDIGLVLEACRSTP